ncbi:MAG: NADH-quinone oxidoreductase subunit K [Thermococcus sp.]|uniref:NADH-quinone oxidoreductase subunit K n=1 Tax=Thermococcus sp. TaxID=35749 RepID=UPI0026136847|nr:NADH-quinone oxidoreductase subunit K [Thermococcus sp.]MCD6139545.1 NADH-quinone oxidoreductase subunit K [Thermococcus sp.]MCD6143952.1 NADH-quinone oxidoreductase subunit K [Thermococcus sp.]
MIAFQFVTAFLMIFMGLYAFLYKRNLIKLILALNLVDAGIHLLLISLGYRLENGLLPTAPIYTGYETLKGTPMVGPIPQALVLTSIVIGVCVLSLAMALTINAYQQYETLDVSKLRRLRG